MVNARDLRWFDGDELGIYTPFEGEEARFEQVGMNIGDPAPRRAGRMYHAEDARRTSSSSPASAC